MPRRALGFTLLFTVMVLLGRSMVLPDTNLALFWPASGAVALWAMASRTTWERAVLGAVVMTVMTVVLSLSDFSLSGALLLGGSNIMAGAGTPALVALLAGRSPLTCAPSRLMRMRTATDASRFVLAVGTASSLSVPFALLALAAENIPLSMEAALAHFFRQLSGILLLTGTALSLRGNRRDDLPTEPWRVLAIGVASVACLVLVFTIGNRLPLVNIVLLPLFWSSVRLPAGIATVHAAATAVATVGLALIIGPAPFGLELTRSAVATRMQLFVTIVMILSLIISTAMSGSRRLSRRLARSEVRARERATFLTAIARTVPDGLVVVREDETVDPLNEAAMIFLTPQPDGLHLPRTKLDLEGVPLAPAQRPSHRALAGEAVHDLPVVVPDASGDTRVYEVSARPLHHMAGPPRAVMLYRDATARYEALEDLHRTRDHALRLFNDAPQGIAVISPDGVIREANPALRALLRCERDLAGLSLLAFARAGDDSLRRLLSRAAHASLPVSSDVTVITARTPQLRLHTTVVRLDAVDSTGQNELLIHAMDISESARLHDELARQARHDPLTGLLNRHGFDEMLAEHKDRFQATGADGALLVMDLDQFKTVNDTLGHPAGDALLRSIAAVLQRTLRSADIVARLGGDEFAVILPGAAEEQAAAVAAKLLRSIAEVTTRGEGAERRVTASIGVATLSAAQRAGSDPMVLADMLMYDAKESGRNKYALMGAANSTGSTMGDRLRIQDRIEQALASSSFELHLQPVWDMRIGEVAAAEALIRMREGESLVQPGSFMPLAERSGLSVRIDCWVVREALRLLAQLHAIVPGFRLSANVAGSSVGSPRYEAALTDALEEFPPVAGTFSLEITETAAVDDMRAARAFATRLATRGISLALDDFGAGYGSFSYLKHLDFDFIKIDGDFVTHLDSSATDQSIVRSLVQVARDLNKRTIAEHVVTEAILDKARQLGVDYAQGYAIGRPVPPQEFVRVHFGALEVVS